MSTKQLLISQKEKRHHVLPDGNPQYHLWPTHDKDLIKILDLITFSERKENYKNALEDTIGMQSEKSSLQRALR